MKYVGAKHRIGKQLSQFMCSAIPPYKVSGYLEPFCGSLGVFKNMVSCGYKKNYASDVHKDLILMWNALKNDQLNLPANMNYSKWKKLKDQKEPSALRGAIGFGLSFGGDFFSGYIQKYASDSGRDFYTELKNSLNKIQPIINKPNVNFYNKNYYDWNPKNMLIYCDPPYKNTTQYKTDTFDFKRFWDTIRKWSKSNYVFVSEENAPSDFKSVWYISKKRTLNKKIRFDRGEHLFVYKHGLLNKFKKTTFKKGKGRYNNKKTRKRIATKK